MVMLCVVFFLLALLKQPSLGADGARVGQACGVEIQNAQHGNDMLRDLKKSLKTKVRKVERDEDAAHVLDFPALPQGLKDTLGSPAYETWWQNAYGERATRRGLQNRRWPLRSGVAGRGHAF